MVGWVLVGATSESVLWSGNYRLSYFLGHSYTSLWISETGSFLGQSESGTGRGRILDETEEDRMLIVVLDLGSGPLCPCLGKDTGSFPPPYSFFLSMDYISQLALQTGVKDHVTNCSLQPIRGNDIGTRIGS